MSFNRLAEVTLAEDSLEGCAISRIVSAQNSLPIGEEANAGAIVALLRAIVVEEFRRTFVLAHLLVAVIRHGGHQTVVAHLVSVVGGRTPLCMRRSNGLRVGSLVARIAVGRQSELVDNPFAEVARSVGFLCLAARLLLIAGRQRL